MGNINTSETNMQRQKKIPVKSFFQLLMENGMKFLRQLVNAESHNFEEQIAQNATLEDNLEEQDKSTKLIIQELKQRIEEFKEKEREYLQEIDDLQENIDVLLLWASFWRKMQ